MKKIPNSKINYYKLRNIYTILFSNSTFLTAFGLYLRALSELIFFFNF